MRAIVIAIILLAVFIGIGYFVAKRRQQKPLETAPSVNLHQYAGTWYEIARLPNHFEKGCRCVKAQYQLHDKYILVKNTCIKGPQNKLKIAEGKAWPVNKANSKLKVRFFWPFKGDYWIIYIDKAYKYAIVGSPSRKYLWFLSRQTQIDSAVFSRLSQIATQQGFDLVHLIKTDQSTCD